MKSSRPFLPLACGVALLAALGARPVQAADIPQVYEIPEVYQPSGFYAGAFLGWGWGDSVVTNIDPEVDGVFGGGLIGWELRRDGMVAGVEADIGFANIKGVNVAGGTTADVSWLASLRARLGFDGGIYSAYGTVGVAFAGMQASVAGFVPSTDKATLTGIAAGVGLEAMLTDSLAGRLEYIYYSFDDSDFIIGTGAQADLRLHTVRGALVYKFAM